MMKNCHLAKNVISLSYYVLIDKNVIGHWWSGTIHTHDPRIL